MTMARHAVGMEGCQLQDSEVPMLCPTATALSRIQLLDHVRDIIRIGRNGIRYLGLVTLTVPDRLRNTQLS